MSGQEELLPTIEYHLDESDPDTVVLRRQDDTLVAVFSVRGVTPEGIVEAAKEDYREVLRVHLSRQATLPKILCRGRYNDFSGSLFYEVG